jgi:DNA-binding XRE family transcriptional regulator
MNSGESSRVSIGFSPARILSLRKRLGLTQSEMGALTGVDRESVLGWEKGKFKPKEEMVLSFLFQRSLASA